MARAKNQEAAKQAESEPVKSAPSGPRIRNKEIRTVRVADILDHPKNWRRHPAEQQAALDGVVSEIGWIGYPDAFEHPSYPGKIMLVDGHLRKAHLIGKYGEDAEIQVNVTDLDIEEADKALVTRDPLAAMAETDAAILRDVLAGIEAENADLAAMLEALDEDAQAILEDAAESEPPEITEDEVPEPPADPITRPGDLWILGEHRLLCGDSTKAEDVKKLMEEMRAYLLATDPPYGVNFAGAKYNPRAKHWDGIQNDTKQGEDLKSFVVATLNAWVPYIDEAAGFYFWTAAMEEGAAAAAAIREIGLHIQSQIIWNKNTLVLGQADYQWKHENCWYAFWKGKHHRWFGGRDKTTVWDVAKVANSAYEHPMQKPVELYAIPIRHHTQNGEVIAEPFAGSGSQFIAAEQLGRKCYGMEIGPQYCDVILNRFRKLRPNKPITRQDGKTWDELSAA